MTMNLISFSRKGIISFLTGIVLFIVFLIFSFSGKPQLVFLTYSEKATVGEVYWGGQSVIPLDKTTTKFLIKEKTYQTFSFDLPPKVISIDSIGLVPGNEKGNRFTICYVLFKKGGFKPIEINLEQLVAVRGTSKMNISNELSFITTSEKPLIQFKNQYSKGGVDWILIIVFLLLSLVVSVTLYFSIEYFSRMVLKPLSLLIIICLTAIIPIAVLIAKGSGFNASPDERDHFLGAEYYKTHSVTPYKNSRLATYTYNSIWDYSRVYLKGVDYFMAGKFSNLFGQMTESYIAVRFFELLMLVILVFLAIRFSAYSAILLSLLITPQAWYLFSYMNDGCVPLFLSFALLLLTEAFKPLLTAGGLKGKSLVAIILTGFIFGLILLSKKNYLVYDAFFIGYLVILPFRFTGKLKYDWNEFQASFRRYFKSFLLVLVIAISVLGLRELTVEKADSQPLSKGLTEYYAQSKVDFDHHVATGISGKERFGSYFKMLKTWLPVNNNSFCGTYGNMEFWGSSFYYISVWYLYLMIALGILFWSTYKRDYELMFWVAVTGASFLIMYFASSYWYSYRYDYQPQGKYILPVLPVLGFMLYKIKIKYSNSFFRWYILPISLLLFCLSYFSFVRYGYLNLCK